MTEPLLRLFEQTKAAATCTGCGAGVDCYEALSGRVVPMTAAAIPQKRETDARGRIVAFFRGADAHECPEAAQIADEAES